MKISKEKIFGLMLVLFFMINLSSCLNSNDKTINKEKDEISLTVNIYDEKQETFKELVTTQDQQRKILEQLNELKKDSNLYDSNNQYLGLDNAYSEGTYLIKVHDNKEYEIEIGDDSSLSTDNKYWYNIKSKNKDKEGIYKTSYNLKERIDQIIFEEDK